MPIRARTDKAFRTLTYFHVFARQLLVAVLVLIAVNAYAFTLFRVDGHSMLPTLRDRQFLAVNLLAFVAHPPADGMIVIVQYEGDHSVHFVKRVVGSPGDTVQYNGQSLVLGPNQYFVEGDNRQYSTDSRVYGPIDRSQILGKVLLPLPDAVTLKDFLSTLKGDG